MSRLAHHQAAVYTSLLAEQPTAAEVDDAHTRGDITDAQATILRRPKEIDMAWEDRSKAEKKQARKEAKEYARTDDQHTYTVTTAKGARLTVKGINSAKAVAGKDGQIKRK